MGSIADQLITDRYAIYNGDSMEVLPDLPDQSIHLSVYSPPFGMESGGALYHYTSSERDLSNARTYAEFIEHYGFIVEQIARVTMPGRISAVHCADIPTGNTGRDGLADFPGDIIRLHRSLGFEYVARYHVWKEPLAVRNRTMRKALAHKSIVDDSSLCEVASADYMLTFRRHGDNPVPVTHPTGLTEYFGSRVPPSEVLRYRGWTGNQIENRYSQWVWRQYASAFWDDVRMDNVLPFREARDGEDERHVHPLQLDAIARTVVLRSNPGERVLTPFMGVGSEVYMPVRLGRFGIGVELKPSYYRQAVKNLAAVDTDDVEESGLFDLDVARGGVVTASVPVPSRAAVRRGSIVTSPVPARVLAAEKRREMREFLTCGPLGCPLTPLCGHLLSEHDRDGHDGRGKPINPSCRLCDCGGAS